ncbi:transcriptional regulator with XRE-family HTH domain [Microbacterium sp. SORGH_AS428]|uniref:helix-turn-helix domain-containing protein n=1 Tax=Microbacterium sp. SORGH_AS_0428 TaxID=3041788 RepID=UPI0028628E7C|nr:helix-turn-helix transcriptional regulator [Microbacterium sp. SORGH_AS_0428]MDR6199313.1 transcriptional regulator with XRE-family HTH domain [Microbacterium sp. SORGH_AS_0428]
MTITTAGQWTQYCRMLGDNLSAARAARGLSQEQVARAAGLATFTYQKLEKGESNPGSPANPRLHTLVSLALVLNLELATMLPSADLAKA